jgi:thioesterase domain-containing protein/aryl carrier-like protein
MDGTRLAALLDDAGATVMQATPATWRMLLDAGWKGRPTLTALSGGEALPPDLAAALLERCAALWNMYGPTETTVWSAVDRVRPGAPIVIGAPIANTQLHVLDRRLEPVPVGLSGELYIGGEGLARGYLNRPELTAERFIANPFDSGRTRLYRTGDIVRRRADGALDFVGRADNQVKLRGYRIELGEIESVLAEVPGVAGAAAALRSGPGGHPRLVGYYVAEADAAPAESVVRETIRQRLPEYMVPSVLMPLDAFPLTPAGKLDRKALPDPPEILARPAAADGATDNVRDELAHIWEELLGVAHVGSGDNFFDLGGHSLLAMQLLQRITASFGRSITLNDLFQDPTIDHIADVLTSEELAAAPEPLVRIRDGEGPPLFFLHGDFAFGGLYCNRLAKHLPGGSPLYVLHPHAPGGPATIESMAADYADRIQAVRPHGPYRLAGVCNGGVIGFELARELRRRGAPVEQVVMINARADNVTLRPMLELLDRAGRALGWSAERRRTYLAWQRDGLLELLDRHPRLASGGEAVRRVAAGAVVARLLGRRVWRSVRKRPEPVPPPTVAKEKTALERAQHERQQHIAAAMHGYLPSRYDGPVTLVWAEEEYRALRRDQLLGWDTVASGVELRVIPGGHHTILTRHVAGLAAALGELTAPA